MTVAAAPARAREPRRDLLVAALLFAAVFVLFLLRLHGAEIDRPGDNCVLGGDAEKDLRGLLAGHYGVFNKHKHPLAILAYGAPLSVLRRMGADLGWAVAALQAAMAALGSVGLFAWARRKGAGTLNAALAVGLYLMAFSVLAIFGVVESYALTFLTTVAAALAGEAAATRARGRPVAAALAAGAAAGVAGWAHLPAAVVVLLYAAAVWSVWTETRSRLLFAVAAPVATALLVAALPSLVMATRHGFAWQAGYVEKWASLSNFTRAALVARYAVSSLVYAVVPPVAVARHAFAASELSALVAQPGRGLAYLLAIAAVTAGWVRAAGLPTERPMLAAGGVALAALLVFYLYFNPGETMLYASQGWLFAVLGATAGWGKNRSAVALLATAVLALALVNGPLTRLHVQPEARGHACPELAR